MNTKAKGYILGIIAAATYGMNPLFALPLYKDGMNADSVLFFRYLLAIPILAAMLKIRGHDLRLNRRDIAPMSAMGILVALSSLALFQSYNYMAAGIASTLLFVYPIMVAIIMAAVYRERITLQTALCISLAAAGIGLLYKNEDGGTLDATGTALVFISALSYAVYLVSVNRPRLKNTATLKITLYVLLFGLTLFAARLCSGTELQLPAHWYMWGNLLALAIFPTAISFFCTNKAIQYIGSTPTAILGSLEPVTAIFFGITVFGEIVTIRETIGLTLIIMAVTAVVAGNDMATIIVRIRKLLKK